MYFLDCPLMGLKITKDDLFRFNTVQHDMVTIKQQFKNTKFAFLEREAKIYFLESIETNVQLNLFEFFEESKKRLVEVKNKGLEFGERIKELSIENHDLRKQIDEVRIDHEKLNSLKRQFEGNENKFRQEELLSKAQQEFQEISETAKGFVNELEQLRKEEEKLKIMNDPKYLESLRTRHQELQCKQKRLSRVKYDQMLNDTFSWYDKMIGIIELLFCPFTAVIPKKNGFDMNFRFRSQIITISIRDGSFVDISGTENEQILKIFKWCSKLDNSRLFILLTRNYLLEK